MVFRSDAAVPFLKDLLSGIWCNCAFGNITTAARCIMFSGSVNSLLVFYAFCVCIGISIRIKHCQGHHLRYVSIDCKGFQLRFVKIESVLFSALGPEAYLPGVFDNFRGNQHGHKYRKIDSYQVLLIINGHQQQNQQRSVRLCRKHQNRLKFLRRSSRS